MSQQDENSVVSPLPGNEVVVPAPSDADLSPTDVTALSVEVARLNDAVTSLNAKIGTVTPSVDIQAIADAVATRIMTGNNLAGLPDDMGLPKEFQLGKPLQNYLVWSARLGASWALQSPELLLYVAVMLDAMAKVSDPISRIAAAQAALDDIKKTLHG